MLQELQSSPFLGIIVHAFFVRRVALFHSAREGILPAIKLDSAFLQGLSGYPVPVLGELESPKAIMNSPWLNAAPYPRASAAGRDGTGMQALVRQSFFFKGDPEILSARAPACHGKAFHVIGGLFTIG